MSEILKCPWCDKRRATQLDYDTLQPGEGTDLCWASPECELDGDEEVVLALRLALETATRERDEARRTVEALTPAANYCLEYKPLLLKAEYERDRAVRVLREIAAYGWYAKGAKVARAYLTAREGR